MVLKNVLDSLVGQKTPDEHIFNHSIPSHLEKYTGKVRDIVVHPDHLEMIHTDRLSAFDKHIGIVPYKGYILAELSKFWFNKLSTLGVKTHFITQKSPRILNVEKCKPFPIEVIVRGYLAGSMQRAYLKGERVFCGVRLADGLTPYQKLPEPIITPSTKAAVYEHDENISESELLSKELATADQWRKIKEVALQVFSIGQEVCHNAGWILVDTKYEFGRDGENAIVLIDEAHTPDSSRFWKQDTYASRLSQKKPPDMFDKEVIRQHLIELGYSGIGKVPEINPNKYVELAQKYCLIAEQLMARKIEYSTSINQS